MGRVSASEYGRSQHDPLADSMVEIIQHSLTLRLSLLAFAFSAFVAIMIANLHY
jgi:hypothetical protein